MAAPVTTITPFELRIQASNASLQTALTAYNTAITNAVTQVNAIVHVVANLVQIVPQGMIYDGTNYICTGSVLYKTSVTV